MATTLSSAEHELLRGLFGSEPSSAAYQRLEGSSHKLLRFTIKGDLLFARWPKVTRPEQTWWQEISLHQLAVQYGLAPKVVTLDADKQSTLLLGAAPLQLGLTEVAQLLRRCHQLPKVSQKLNIAHAFRYWHESCAPHYRPWSSEANQQKAEHAARHFAAFNSCLVQSHGDCVETNILQMHNHPVFIDWEYHCLAPRFWDLAIYAESQQLCDKATDSLLRSYHQSEPSLEAKSQLEAFRAIYAELAILWHYATMHGPNHYQTL